MGQPVKPVDAGVAIGEVVLGKYRIDAILGSGAMGVVAKCTHLQLNEQVAIKMLRRDVMRDQDALQRFEREAKAARKLKSEYVARVHDVGTFDNGIPYMLMEFLDGRDLGQMLLDQGPIHWQLAVELALQAAEALAEAHSMSIVHRDIKPSNLFIGWRPDGSPQMKVLDFGISKSQMSADNMSLTQTQSLLGTPAYMSPEQMRSAREVDARSDIWSLGTVLFEIIEGQRPFIADSFSEMCVKVAIDPPGPMVNAPPPLQAVILRCLEKQPERRYANMAELGRELVPLSRDPHSAIVLVERMQRVLRRSIADWDGQSTSSGTPIPRGIRDKTSAPVASAFPDDRTPPPMRSDWSGVSDATGRPLTPIPATPYGGITGDPHGYAPGRAALPATTLNTTAPAPRRGKLLWAVVLLAAAGVGIGVGFAMSTPVKAVAAADAGAPVVAAPPPDAAPAAIVPTTGSAGSAAIVAPPVPPPALDAGVVATPLDAAAPTTEPGGATPDDAGSAMPVPHTTRPPLVHHKSTLSKLRPVLPDTHPQLPTAPCKPEEHPRGCPK